MDEDKKSTTKLSWNGLTCFDTHNNKFVWETGCNLSRYTLKIIESDESVDPGHKTDLNE